ncbi:DNA invertase [Scytonema hofmannii PCC 7110]|uniref:DNA invertase n=1 Tax=Scytonema hofmannii PCC 7110 TaxID=128403 RepID=A0A139XDS2_9CYAN|nr:IS607 family transposase [Scytonema hofmannii]KYC42826.1 DNA invertase [Scytonema hofmannii PCC 7110]
MTRYVTPREAMQILQVSEKTLRDWDKAGRISTIRTPAGHRRYDIDSVLDPKNTKQRKTVLYCRVSSHKQRDDLNRQADYLQSLFPSGVVIKEIGSGLNYKRKGLQTLLGQILSGDVEQVVCSDFDRLARFGIEIIDYICKQNNTKLVVLNRIDLSGEREFVEDILAIIHVFSSKLYGLRKYKQKIKEDPDLPGNQSQNSL